MISGNIGRLSELSKRLVDHVYSCSDCGTDQAISDWPGLCSVGAEIRNAIEEQKGQQ